MARDYNREYDLFQSSPKQIKDRSIRNKANKAARDKGLIKKGDGNDIHHPKGVRNAAVAVMAGNKNKGVAEKSRLPGSNRKKYKRSK